MVASILVFAIGNESRGDDALALLLVRGWKNECAAANYFFLVKATAPLVKWTDSD